MTYFLTKVAQIYVDFLGSFENINFHVQTALVTFWAIFGIFWATLYFSIWSHCESKRKPPWPQNSSGILMSHSPMLKNVYPLMGRQDFD